jgi:hypothetical protein
MGKAMESRTRKSIEGILDGFNSRVEAARREAERRMIERRIFLAEFSERMRTVIRPTMEQVGDLLTSRGHEFEITEEEESVEANGKTANAAITLRIYPYAERPAHTQLGGCPHLAIRANSPRNTIYVHESIMMPGSGGHAGTAGEYELDAVTADMVEQHILSVLVRTLGRS